MGKKIIISTSQNELNSFLNREKYIKIPPELKRKPQYSKESIIQSDFYDPSGVAIPNWFFQITVKDLTQDDCMESYSIFHRVDGRSESVVRLDVHPIDKISHREFGHLFYGAHIHEINTVTSCIDQFEFDCMERENRPNWLSFFANKFKISVLFEQTDGKLFGGWEWTA